MYFADGLQVGDGVIDPTMDWAAYTDSFTGAWGGSIGAGSWRRPRNLSQTPTPTLCFAQSFGCF